MASTKPRFHGLYESQQQSKLIKQAASMTNEKESEYLRNSAEMRAKGTFNELPLEFKAMEFRLFRLAFDASKNIEEARKIVKLMILRGYVDEADQANQDLNFEINYAKRKRQ